MEEEDISDLKDIFHQLDKRLRESIEDESFQFQKSYFNYNSSNEYYKFNHSIIDGVDFFDLSFLKLFLTIFYRNKSY